MNSIRKKILSFTTIVIIIMSIIWIALTFYNYKTQVKYNDILNRYLILSDVSRSSNQVITDLNNYMNQSTPENLKKLENSKKVLESARYEVFKVRNEVNDFTLTNYINLMGSLIETTDRLLGLERDSEAAVKDLAEITRISNYISDMTLTLIDMELKTHEPFYRGIMEQSIELVKLAIWMVLLTSLLLLLATYWFSLSITHPVQQLTKAASELAKGKFDDEITVKSNDEIAFLAKTFDHMRTNINNLIQQIKEKAKLEHELQQNKILLQESHFRSLQSQMNPHFLFNTLNTLSKKAYLEGSEEISDLLVSVADLLRYNLKQIDRSVTLRDELIVVNQYMQIQKARFTDRLQLQLDIDDSCLHVAIPALTLQPIIENAVIHAIEPNINGGVITIQVKDMIEYVLVRIIDDGIGMPDEIITQILLERQVQSAGHSTGIGFSNVVKRLRLFYERDDVIHIESSVGSGTTVLLKIPKQRGELHD
ncbi:histidine kinase [Bacillus sp. ISL-35]|uniref:sensor histidine kinase n=1 Tax=Bacillus sp. ISL-35 TaxID=2819122 RepID=UPI001BE56730|nr:histidine kinase [Bacillus sp. ISL-35]MBT2680375.1 histidine kinase [Bacillus sp. ISL-35]MBT2704333.1 histidine kinase [Chryseobacterium sp. ISL-80]